MTFFLKDDMSVIQSCCIIERIERKSRKRCEKEGMNCVVVGINQNLRKNHQFVGS